LQNLRIVIKQAPKGNSRMVKQHKRIIRRSAENSLKEKLLGGDNNLNKHDGKIK
jgi:hypothetical protein